MPDVIDSTLSTLDSHAQEQCVQECAQECAHLRTDGLTQPLTIEEVPLRRQGQNFESPEQKAMVQALFLEEFSSRANVTDACAIAGISRETAYQWIRNDPVFADLYQVAQQKADDVLLREAHRRAVEGTPEYVVSMGKLVYLEGEPLTVRKYSDTLLLTLMRARMPEYRDSRSLNVEQNIQVNTSHTLTIDTRGMNQDELAAIRQIAQAMKEREQARIEKTGKDSSTGDG